jgi:hypothetical protein
VILRRARLLLARYQILEVGLLRRSALQQQKELQGPRVFYRAKVWRVCNVLADISLQGCQNMFVDRRATRCRGAAGPVCNSVCARSGETDRMPRKSAASENAPGLMRREEIAAFRVNTSEHTTDEVRMGDSPDRETHHSFREKERRSVQKRRHQ